MEAVREARRPLLTLAALALALGLTGCAMANRHTRRASEAPSDLLCEARSAGRSTAAAPAPASPATPDADRSEALTAALAAWRAEEAERGRTYRIAPGDVLEVQVYELEAVEKNEVLAVEVSPAGEVRLPLIGAVPAAGQSTDALCRAIQQRLAADYMVDPQVSVSIREYHGRQVTVMGAVEKPGVFNLRESAITLLDALAMAGGLSDRAGGTILVARGPPAPDAKPAAAPASPGQSPAPPDSTAKPDPPGAEPGPAPDPSRQSPAPPALLCEARYAGRSRGPDPPARVAVVLDELLDGRADRNLLLSDGDVVHVPEARQFFVTGLVVKPGAYPLRRPTTVLEAISTAGGVTTDASPEATRLIRTAGGSRQVVAVPLDRAADRREANLCLEPNDVLEVVQTPGKRFWTGFAEGFSRVFGVGVSLGSL